MIKNIELIKDLYFEDDRRMQKAIRKFMQEQLTGLQKTVLLMEIDSPLNSDVLSFFSELQEPVIFNEQEVLEEAVNKWIEFINDID